MKLKLNFNVDEPTKSGHIYSKELLKRVFDERFSNSNLFVTYDRKITSIDYSLNISNIVAEAKNYEITDDSEIFISIKILNFPKIKNLKDKKFELTIFGFGTLKDDGITISDDYKLSHFFIVEV